MDIVERLRFYGQANMMKWSETVNEAADEIERLRKENQKLALDLIAVLGQWHDNYEQNDDK
jgi:hypothetical protein